MKRIFSIAVIAAAILLAACDSEAPGLGTNEPAGSTATVEQIASINKQIAAIQSSLSVLSKTEAELEQYIAALQESDMATDAQIAAMQSSQAELSEKISATEKSIGQTRDWVSATFTTLEQYNALAEALAKIKASIPDDIPDMERINESLDKKIEQSTESMKEWINEKFTGYCTLAQTEALLSGLQKDIDNSKLEAKDEIANLRSQLLSTKDEITEAYKKAIKEAIENGGDIGGGTAADLNAVNELLDGRIAAVNAEMDTLKARLGALEKSVSQLLSRIQSVTYIPYNDTSYDNGESFIRATPDDKGSVTLDFLVSPKSAVAELEKVWQSALSLKAVNTTSITRARDFIDMPIESFEADHETGVITITASGENISDSAWAYFENTDTVGYYHYEKNGVCASLFISDGNSSSITSEYIHLNIDYLCELYLDAEVRELEIPKQGGEYLIKLETNYRQELFIEVRPDYHSEYRPSIPASIIDTDAGKFAKVVFPPNNSGKRWSGYIDLHDPTNKLLGININISQDC